jgi:hypothetical protein
MNKTTRSCFFLFFLLFSGPATHSQGPKTSSGADRPMRIEIPARSTDETYHIIPVNSTGVLLYFRSVETLNDSLTKWYFSLYDQNLNTIWVKSIPVRTGLEVKDYFLEHEMLTLFFLAGEKTKGITAPEMIVTLDCKSGKFRGSRHSISNSILPVKFVVVQGTAYLGYNIKNEPAHIQVIRLESGTYAEYPLGTSGSVSTLNGFIVDTLGRTVYATIRRPEPKNHTACFLLKINDSGSILSETEVSTVSPLWELRNPQLVLVNNDDLLVIATYAYSGRSGKNVQGSGASGFFTCRFRNGVQTDVHFMNFLDLKNSGNIVGEKDMEAIRKKALKKNRPLNDYISEVNLLVHPLIVTNDQVIFMGESYTPEYHPENFTEFDFYGRPYINTYNVFDGYRYTSAIIAGFDQAGNMKWDNSMEIRNLISAELLPRVNLYRASPDSMVLCYSSEARIASKIIHENEVVEKLDFSALEQLNPEDKMLSDTKNCMVPWYGPYFLCYGYQEIKNINSSENKKRLVYYFTKVRFD